MRTELHYFDIFPKVVPAGRPVRITIRPRGAHVDFAEGEAVTLRFLPMENTLERVGADASYPFLEVAAEHGALSFEWTFEGEQQHLIRIYRETPRRHARRRGYEQLSVYSAQPDLYALRPYRGDLHVHTHHSDGQESVEMVVANYRKAGYDFMAITDHGTWEPSDMAIKAYENVPTGIRLYHGEEVHAPDNHTHVVNFGGEQSVNRAFTDDPEMYAREVLAIREALPALPEGVDPVEYASNVWLARRIRACDGLAIFPHPHWIANVFHVRDAMSWHLFETGVFDAFELLGGQEQLPNNMQTAFYQEARAHGMRIPIVGSSDSHGTVNADWFNWTSTIVFAPDSEKRSLIDAVKALQSVAVETYPNEHFRVHGPYRFVKYAIFLLEELFPQHDALCRVEGELMLDAVCGGDADAAALLPGAAARADAYLRRCFGQ